MNAQVAYVDNDKEITEKDAKIILAYYVELIDTLPHTCRFAGGKCACGIERVNELHKVTPQTDLKKLKK